MPFQPRIGSATWSRESCERELPLCPRETSTEAWARSCRSSKENRRIRCKATSPFREGRVMNLSIFRFFCLLSRSSPFFVPVLSFIPSKASCSAPSAPPCAARVLAAQLRAPPLRPDAASRPVSLFFFWRGESIRSRADRRRRRPSHRDDVFFILFPCSVRFKWPSPTLLWLRTRPPLGQGVDRKANK